MVRISNTDLDRLKRDVDLVELVRSSGVELERRGKDLVGRCPFHDDKTPSLVVSTGKNLWHCMGACQAGGTVIDWVMRTQRVAFVKAVELLSGKPARTPEAPEDAAPVELSDDDKRLLQEVTDYYHETFKRTPAASAYLQSRGLSSSEMLERFRIGFCDRTLCARLPGAKTAEGKEIRERLQRLGVLRASNHEHFWGCVTFPIIGEDGAVVGMYGRNHQAGRENRHFYLRGPHRGVWNASAVRASGTVIICEAIIDALTFWCAGLRNVTTSYGVNGFTGHHEQLFSACKVERVLIAYDADDAGNKAAMELAAQMRAQGRTCWRVQFPKGMDANEYARKVRPAERSLELAIRNAVMMTGNGVANGTDLFGPADEPVVTIATEQQVAAVEAPVEATAPEAAVEQPAPITPAAPSAAKEMAPKGPSSAAAVVPPILMAPPSPAPTTVAPEMTVEELAEEVVVTLGTQRYRVRGLSKNTSLEAMRVNIFVARGAAFYVDTLDLNQAPRRVTFMKTAAMELGLSDEEMKRDMSKLYGALMKLQDELIKKVREPKTIRVEISEGDRTQAMDLLKDKRLLERIEHDFERCGVVGERMNKLAGYVAVVSRKLEKPLAVLVQSSSAAGKSSLMDAVLSFLPDEDVVKYSAMTERSLYYMGETQLKNRVLALAEEEGAERASYALKLLQSEGELRIASTGKDPVSGKLETKEYYVQGPSMILMTTTAVTMDEEFLNRCMVLTVDEGREQTRAIHEMQRLLQTREGIVARRERAQVLKVHRNAQRLLRPLGVMNPFARLLTFPDDKTRLRRDHNKYITLIAASALLHQHQREIVRELDEHGAEREYVMVTVDDVALANELGHKILGRSLDELPPHTRQLLEHLDEMVRRVCEQRNVSRPTVRFSRRLVREYTGWGPTQVHVHLQRLVELEYLLPHRGMRGQSFEYELIYDGQGKDGTPFLPGLIDVEALRVGKLEESIRGPRASIRGAAESIRGQFGANPVPSGPLSDAETPRQDAEKRVNGAAAPKNGTSGVRHYTLRGVG